MSPALEGGFLTLDHQGGLYLHILMQVPPKGNAESSGWGIEQVGEKRSLGGESVICPES